MTTGPYFAGLHTDRVIADGGTVYVAGRAREIVNGLRDTSSLDQFSLIVPFDAGKALTLYSINVADVTAESLRALQIEAHDAEADYSVTAVPDLVAERSIAGTEVQLNVRNTGAPEVRYFKATEVMANFTALVDVPPTNDYEYEDDPVDDDVDYKYKAAFVSAGTRNGNPHEVVGQRSASVYVIADTSTL